MPWVYELGAPRVLGRLTRPAAYESPNATYPCFAGNGDPLAGWKGAPCTRVATVGMAERMKGVNPMVRGEG